MKMKMKMINYIKNKSDASYSGISLLFKCRSTI